MFEVEKWRDGNTWSNWSGSHLVEPNDFSLPESIEEVCAVVRKASQFGQTIRVTGAAHSFSPVAKPEQIAMSLHLLRGLIDVNQEAGEATFYAGTYLHEIGPLLAPHGFALSNMGDIQEQSLAGVISTGTHGTGVTLGSFAQMVVKWGFVNGRGEYIEHERGDDDLSRALHVSVGLLGILVKVTIKVIPLYNLHYIARKENLLEELPKFADSIQNNRHVEWYYFPGAETIQVKQMNMAPYKPSTERERKLERLKLQVVENGALYLISELCRVRPGLSRGAAKLSSLAVSDSERNDVSYEIFPSPRTVRFVESEHAIALDRFEEAMEEIHWTFVRHDMKVHFPIECRTSSGEDGFLSPTMGRDSAFIAFHMYKGMNEKFYFNWVREVMAKYDSRPHWGKVNWYAEDDVYALYPNAKKFEEIRLQHDPNGIFMTEYFKNVFLK